MFQAEEVLLLLPECGLACGLLLPARHGEERPRVGYLLGLPGLLLQRGGAQHLGEVRPFGQILEVIDLEGRPCVGPNG
jgi:hypothetical protein